jgi:hypothetical protein
MSTHAPGPIDSPINSPTDSPINSPWVLVDDVTVDQTLTLLERLAQWLDEPDTAATGRCTRALSLDETDDPETILYWADALAGRLRDLVLDSQLDPHRPNH